MRLHTILTVLAALSALPAQAATNFCVGTSAELRAALNDVKTDGDDNGIRLRSGTYTTLPGTAFTTTATDNHSITITGGWAGAGCSSQSQDPSLTVLQADPGSASRVLQITGGVLNQYEISLNNLTLRNGDAPVNGYGGCLLLTAQEQNLRVERLIFEGCRATLGTGAALHVDGMLMRVSGNLVTDNTSRRAAVSLNVRDGGWGYVNNNTVTGNLSAGATGTALGLLAVTGVGGRIWFSNNIIWGNNPGTTNFDLDIGLADTVFSYNHLGNAIGNTGPQSVGTTFGDAGFTGGSLPQLAPGSMCRDSGTNNPTGGTPAQDLLGRNRPQGPKTDRGAFEALFIEAIFSDDFDLN
ncbi:choice-of-anchor Q domain-containing protein [Tahibacter harae]|uniref:Parallel beta helix pectate lyase-like protein n=1 Tax=Tahibacter harae TaxID=2963937 RepID=A0ABT1QYM7_9GAMM|nr:choice-of-anchor Q domain-containing protein [Tahibacter harae]MCQ4167366.1 hypothetical protein [Tahibacter harae]